MEHDAADCGETRAARSMVLLALLAYGLSRVKHDPELQMWSVMLIAMAVLMLHPQRASLLSGGEPALRDKYKA